MIDKIKNAIGYVLKKIGFQIEDEFKLWNGSVVFKKKLKDGTWEEVEFPNKVLLPGLQVLAKWLFGKEFKVKYNSFEKDLSDDSADAFFDNITKTSDEYQIRGFNLHIDGSVGTDVIPYDKHKRGYDFDSLIPFRVVPEADNNYAEFTTKYAHSRVKVYRDSTGVEHRYVEYFTKKVDIDYTVKTDKAQDVPDFPHENLHTDKDIRVIATFNITVDEGELREWFSLNKRGKMESSAFNGISTWIGNPATIEINGSQYPTLINTYVFSRLNTAMISHAVDGTVLCVYKIRLI